MERALGAELTHHLGDEKHDPAGRGSGNSRSGYSTCCWLLQGVAQRDADTWGVHLMDAAQQGLDPDYTVVDAGSGFAPGRSPYGVTSPATATCSTFASWRPTSRP